MRPLLIALAALAVPPPPAHAVPVQQTAAAGDVRATLRGEAPEDDRSDRVLEDVRDLTLEIERGGETFRPPLPPCKPGCGPPLQFASFHAEDLDGDGEPEVTVDRYLGGTVCCTGSATIFRWDPIARGYVPSRRTMGSDYALRDLDGDGIPEILTDDARFFARFAPRVAGLHLPWRILQYRAGRFSVVTTQHRDWLLRSRRARAKRVALLESRLRRRVGSRAAARLELRASVPALVAEDRLLGERAKGDARLRRGRRLGWASAAYVRDVRGFLRRTGY